MNEHPKVLNIAKKLSMVEDFMAGLTTSPKDLDTLSRVVKVIVDGKFRPEEPVDEILPARKSDYPRPAKFKAPCGKSFSNPRSKKAHQGRCVKCAVLRKARYKCKVCGRPFKTRFAHNAHMRTHKRLKRK